MPWVALRTLPSAVDPEIVGGAVLTGGLAWTGPIGALVTGPIVPAGLVSVTATSIVCPSSLGFRRRPLLALAGPLLVHAPPRRAVEPLVGVGERAPPDLRGPGGVHRRPVDRRPRDRGWDPEQLHRRRRRRGPRTPRRSPDRPSPQRARSGGELREERAAGGEPLHPRNVVSRSRRRLRSRDRPPRRDRRYRTGRGPTRARRTSRRGCRRGRTSARPGRFGWRRRSRRSTGRRPPRPGLGSVGIVPTCVPSPGASFLTRAWRRQSDTYRSPLVGSTASPKISLSSCSFHTRSPAGVYFATTPSSSLTYTSPVAGSSATPVAVSKPPATSARKVPAAVNRSRVPWSTSVA